MIFTVKPEWRTSTVIELCRSMREAQDFSALPILADAIEDAGCDDQELLATLRERIGSSDYVSNVRIVALLMSEDTARSITWITSFAGRYHFTFEEMMKGALNGSLLGDELEGEYIPDEFWDHFEKVTGKTGVERDSFFRCSC